MDIYEYLKLDHQKVDKLFALFENSPEERNQLEIIAMIEKELLLHAISEQATFYAALENNPISEKDVMHSEDEHQEIFAKLKEIHQEEKMSRALKRKMKELKKIVKHHVSEEEGKIFREAKKILSDKEAYILKEKMHDYKEKLLYKQKNPSVEVF